ncbi:hypothetical protein EYF80_059429 [Liparis tanakae]|uniref:Uncharacterized protein n=1 Tax=Liparis tanakae TaxID=230148 RepID=A0A4Z2ENU2_9TELE|nr:hypothetical protein EYF80_059429 [Liparis tanakae]
MRQPRPARRAPPPQDAWKEKKKEEEEEEEEEEKKKKKKGSPLGVMWVLCVRFDGAAVTARARDSGLLLAAPLKRPHEEMWRDGKVLSGRALSGLYPESSPLLFLPTFLLLIPLLTGCRGSTKRKSVYSSGASPPRRLAASPPRRLSGLDISSSETPSVMADTYGNNQSPAAVKRRVQGR